MTNEDKPYVPGSLQILTLEEQERKAYMAGDAVRAALLGQLLDTEQELLAADALSCAPDSASDHEGTYDEGYDNGLEEGKRLGRIQGLEEGGILD